MTTDGALSVLVRDDGPSLTAAQRAVTHFLESAQAAPRIASRADVLIEEVVLNAFRHAGVDAVDITAALVDGGLVLAFEDAGIAFDPLAAPLPEPSPNLAEARIGGLGLVLVRKLTSAARYVRLPTARNRLELTIAPPA